MPLRGRWNLKRSEMQASSLFFLYFIDNKHMLQCQVHYIGKYVVIKPHVARGLLIPVRDAHRVLQHVAAPRVENVAPPRSPGPAHHATNRRPQVQRSNRGSILSPTFSLFNEKKKGTTLKNNRKGGRDWANKQLITFFRPIHIAPTYKRPGRLVTGKLNDSRPGRERLISQRRTINPKNLTAGTARGRGSWG